MVEPSGYIRVPSCSPSYPSAMTQTPGLIWLFAIIAYACAGWLAYSAAGHYLMSRAARDAGDTGAFHALDLRAAQDGLAAFALTSATTLALFTP